MKASTRLTLTGVAAVVLLAGCAKTGPRQQSGAIIGGMSGAFLGAATGTENQLRRAAVGAAAGAMAGGMIGTMLEQQEQDLRAMLENDGILVRNTGEELIVTFPGGLLFDVSSAVVEPAVQRDLGALARNLVAFPNSTVRVIGHTDSTGSATYNQGLSERRAAAVAGVLVDRGVSSARVTTIGRGETQPVASNETEEGRRQNRRTEIIIRPTST
jgi:outer membrane protein OmpA-like peptidoglycan-associated protein